MTSKKRKESNPSSSEPPFKKTKSVSKKSESNTWQTHELVSELEDINVNLSRTITKLFEDDFTISFLCRYRKDLIENLSPNKLREIKNTIDNVKLIEASCSRILKSLEKESLLTDEIARNIKAAKSLDELEHLSLLYKPASKGSLYERAEKIGLVPVAENILHGQHSVNLSTLVNSKVVGLQALEEVETGVRNVMSHLITKSELVMNEVRDLEMKFRVKVSSSQAKQKKADAEQQKGTAKSNKDSQKFENYFNFSSPADRIKPHQILAINRGKSLKVLSIKYEVDDRLHERLKHFATNFYLKQGRNWAERTKLFNDAFTDAYRKKISPFIVRQTQSELARRAEKSAVDSFATNLKNLLLMNPVKGRKILGIDPGFKSGCKLAMISEAGEMLETGHVIHPHERNKVEGSERIVSDLLNKFDCSLIAIGNATACRETENFISKLIEKKHHNVQYCIVSEQGASIYSCSDIAKKEFPSIDVSFIGAISIARRLLDPLCELVKIEPKHLGVGMYQHDVNEKALKKTLDEIISECVSFVGVDLNVANFSLLKHVAGLTEKRAEAIVSYREKNGCFRSRSDLLKVKSIGAKSYTQCAGFVRINGLSAGIKKYNLLDSTNVHPESYETASAIMKDCGVKLEDIGKPKFVEKILEYRQRVSLDKIAAKFKENPTRIETVLEALAQNMLHDYRSEVKIEPVFKKGIADISSLKPNKVVSGVVMNIADFGAFVDLGVGTNGLIHSSAMRGANLKVSDRVECKILQVDAVKGRIGLEFKSLLS